MMNRIKSTRLHLVKFLFLFPLLAVLLLAFRDRYERKVSFPKQIQLFDTLPQSQGARAKGTEQQRTEQQRADHQGDGRQNDEPRSDGQKGIKTQGNNNKNISLIGVTILSDTLRPLYIVNGDPMPENWSVASIPETEIKSIDVLKGDQAIRLFGAKGAGGVIAITTTDKKVIQIRLISKDQIKINEDKNQIKVILLNMDENKIGVQSDTIILSDKKKNNLRENVN